MMSSLYIGATGIKTLGEGMNVVSNNLANVNTVGFKKTMMIYQDLMSQTQNSRSNNITNLSQVGMGSRVGETHKIFTQGAFEPGSAATDLGIEGLGFFGVQKNGITHYTRAGNFRFTAEGDLLDPSGWNLLGYGIDKNGAASTNPTPIKLDMTPGSAHSYMGPKATTSLTAITQLGALENKTDDTANPFFGMASKWDATQKPPLTSSNYSYKQPVQFYDSNGNVVNATMYFDLAGQKNGSKAAEYVLALDPEDVSADVGEGLLMAGTLTFDSAGTITNMTAFTPPGGDPTNLAGWTPAALQNGAPVFSVGGQSIGLNMGLTLTTSSAGLSSAADLATNQDAVYAKSPGSVLQNNYSHARSTSNASVFQSRDGWAEGELSDIQVTDDGYVRGKYSNGQTQDLFQIPLYRFTSQDGLRSEGHNHYSATPESGPATHGVAGTENYGKIAERSLEVSNVDHADEFVTMIVTQRGFQMNSKVITTSDAMLQKAMEIKR